MKTDQIPALSAYVVYRTLVEFFVFRNSQCSIMHAYELVVAYRAGRQDCSVHVI